MIKIYKFSSNFCGPCKIYKPIFDKVINNLKELYDDIEVQEIDIDADDGTSKANSFNIMAIPTTVVTDKDDKVYFKEQGIIPEHILSPKLKALHKKINSIIDVEFKEIVCGD